MSLTKVTKEHEKKEKKSLNNFSDIWLRTSAITKMAEYGKFSLILSPALAAFDWLNIEPIE